MRCKVMPPIMLPNCNSIKAVIDFFTPYLDRSLNKLVNLVGSRCDDRPEKLRFDIADRRGLHTATFRRQQLLALSSKFLTLLHTHTPCGNAECKMQNGARVSCGNAKWRVRVRASPAGMQNGACCILHSAFCILHSRWVCVCVRELRT